MGRTTNRAMRTVRGFKYQKQLHQMQGALVLKDRKANKYLAIIKQVELDKGAKGRPHIEESLFAQLKKRYRGNLLGIPNNTTLVFFCKWSPCKRCATGCIPSIADELNIKAGQRGLIVKFKFETFYTKSDWENAIGEKTTGVEEYFWKDADEARTAYEKLMLSYGFDKTKDVMSPDETAYMSIRVPNLVVTQLDEPVPIEIAS